MSLDPGASHDITLTFAPTSEGHQSARVSLVANAGNRQAVSFITHGYGGNAPDAGPTLAEDPFFFSEVAAGLFGLGTFLWPGITLAVLVLLYGGYLFIDGILAILWTISRGRQGAFSWGVLLAGVASLAAGVVTLLWPGVPAGRSPASLTMTGVASRPPSSATCTSVSAPSRSNGVNTMAKMAVDFGLAIGLEASGLIKAILLVQFIGFHAAILFGYIGEWIGPLRGIAICWATYLFVTLYCYFLDTSFKFYMVASIIGVVQGGIGRPGLD